MKNTLSAIGAWLMFPVWCLVVACFCFIYVIGMKLDQRRARHA